MDNGVGDVFAVEHARAPHEPLCQVPVPESFDLERQKSHFLVWIEEPQIAIELHAIDHTERRAEADVLRAKIAMPLDDTCPAKGERGSQACRALELRVGHRLHESLLQAGAKSSQRAPICRYLPAEPVHIGRAVHRMTPGAPVESRKAPQQGFEPGRGNSPACKNPVEHLLGRQAAHLDEPVLDACARAELQCTRPIGRQRHDRQIDGRSETPVEPQFLAAARAPCRARAVVHDRLAQRLL